MKGPFLPFFNGFRLIGSWKILLPSCKYHRQLISKTSQPSHCNFHPACASVASFFPSTLHQKSRPSANKVLYDLEKSNLGPTTQFPPCKNREKTHRYSQSSQEQSQQHKIFFGHSFLELPTDVHFLLTFGKNLPACCFGGTHFSPIDSEGLTEKGSGKVGEPGRYPEGKPSWEQLQHVALRLSDSVPKFFNIQQDYTFYRQDVELINRIQNVYVKGLKNYWYHLATLRTLAGFRYSHTKMTVLSITPVIEDGTVRLRWRVEYLGFIDACIAFWKYGKDLMKHTKWLDGYAIFFLDGTGLVYKVVIDKVMPDEEKAGSKKKGLAAKVAAALGEKAAVPTPT